VSEYTLPDLSYDYGALEPHVSGQIMELHHSKHHQTYVTALNGLIGKLAEARSSGFLDAIVGLEKPSRSTWVGTSTTQSSGRTFPPTAATSPAATSPPPSTTSLARCLPVPLHRRRHHDPGLRLGDPGLGHSRLTAAGPPALRPAGQPAGRSDPTRDARHVGPTRRPGSTPPARPPGSSRPEVNRSVPVVGRPRDAGPQPGPGRARPLTAVRKILTDQSVRSTGGVRASSRNEPLTGTKSPHFTLKALR
jgi:hypothetical protein